MVVTTLKIDDRHEQVSSVQDASGRCKYNILTSVLKHDVNVVYPPLPQMDKHVFENFAQLLQNKTINLSDNSISDYTAAAGDLIKFNNISKTFARFPVGTANQFLAVNPSGTDVTWVPAPSTTIPSDVVKTDVANVWATAQNLPTGSQVNSDNIATLVATQALTHKDLTDATNTFPTSLATLTGTQALTNKDLTGAGNTFPTSLVTLAGTQALTNKDLTGAGNTFPSSLVTLTTSQALSNKDLTAGTNTFPASLVTLATSQTLTNKNLTDATNTFPSSLVTLTASQALTNKNLTDATNIFPSSLVTLTGAQSLTNKNLNDPTNILPPLVFPSQLKSRWGIFEPAGYASLGTGQGIIRDLTTVSGTVGTTFINNRPAMTFTSTSGSHNNAGLRTTNPICTMTNDPTVRFKVTCNSNTNFQLELGFTSSSSLGSSFNSCLNSSLNGCMIGFSDGDTSYSVITNNGGTSQTNNTGLLALQTAGTPAIFTLQYNHATPSVTWTIQTGPSTITGPTTITTGNLPSATAQLYLFCNQINGAATSSNVLTVEEVEIILGSDYSLF